MNKNIVLNLNNITKSFTQGSNQLTILQNACLTIESGELVALVGPSGSGKSTLLQITGLLDHPDHGEVLIDQINCSKMRDDKQTITRLNKIGFVYQSHHLLQEFTALENVMIPQLISKKNYNLSKERATELLTNVDLAHRIEHYPNQLSGGEQQRVAIARALANNPALFLADEPTGNLDPVTSNLVTDLMIQFLKQNNMSALIVTHNLQLANKLDKIVTIQDSKIVEV